MKQAIPKIVIVIALLIALLGLTKYAALAETTTSGINITTGYDLYHELNKPPEAVARAYVMGYIMGCIDGCRFMHTIFSEAAFNKPHFTKNEKRKILKEVDSWDLNIPVNVTLGQIVLIYKKYAEKYPERLSQDATSCIFLALHEALILRQNSLKK